MLYNSGGGFIVFAYTSAAIYTTHCMFSNDLRALIFANEFIYSNIYVYTERTFAIIFRIYQTRYVNHIQLKGWYGWWLCGSEDEYAKRWNTNFWCENLMCAHTTHTLYMQPPSLEGGYFRLFKLSLVYIYMSESYTTTNCDVSEKFSYTVWWENGVVKL